MRFHASKEISQLVARHANDAGAHATAVDSLSVARHTSLSALIHCAQSPTFGMVVQGRMSIELGGQAQLMLLLSASIAPAPVSLQPRNIAPNRPFELVEAFKTRNAQAGE